MEVHMSWLCSSHSLKKEYIAITAAARSPGSKFAVRIPNYQLHRVLDEITFGVLDAIKLYICLYRAILLFLQTMFSFALAYASCCTLAANGIFLPVQLCAELAFFLWLHETVATAVLPGAQL